MLERELAPLLAGQSSTALPVTFVAQDGTRVGGQIVHPGGMIEAPASAVTAFVQATDGGPPIPVVRSKNGEFELESPAWPVVYGQVLRQTGRPVGGLQITLRDVNGTVIARTVTDAKGVWTLAVNGDSGTVTFGDDTTRDLASLPRGGAAFVTVNGTADTSTAAPISALQGLDPLLASRLIRTDPSLFTSDIPSQAADPCSPFLPRSIPSEAQFISRLLLAPRPADALNVAPISIDDVLDTEDAAFSLRYGAEAVYWQTWTSLGFSLGHLMSSVSLAPAEQVRIAVLDAQTLQSSTAQQDVREQRTDQTDLARNRAVADAMTAHASKSSQQGTVQAAASASYAGLASASAGFTYQWGGSLTEALNRSTQDLADTLQQVASSVRDTHATSVVELTGQETTTATTRVVRNHNKCRTLTFFYYELVEQWKVQTRLRELRPLVLIPFVPLEFTPTVVTEYGVELREMLPAGDLVDALDRYLELTPPQPPPPSTTPPADVGAQAQTPSPTAVVSAITAQLTLGTPINYPTTDLLGSEPWLRDYIVFRVPPPSNLTLQSPDQQIDNNTWTIHIPLSPGTTLQDLVGLELFNRHDDPNPHDSHQNAHFDHSTVQAIIDGRPVTLFDGGPLVLSNGAAAQLLPANLLAAASGGGAGGASGGAPTLPAPPHLPESLRRHLQANRLQYTADLLMAQPRLWHALERTPFGRDDTTRSLADVTVGDPIGVVGNYLVFRATSFEIWPQSMTSSLGIPPRLSSFTPSTPPRLPHLSGQPGANDLPTAVPDATSMLSAAALSALSDSLVTLPTGGAYCEGRLGQCGCCETIDQNVYRDWTDSDAAQQLNDQAFSSRLKDLASLATLFKSDLSTAQIQALTEPDLAQLGPDAMAKLVDDFQLSDPGKLSDFIHELQTAAGHPDGGEHAADSFAGSSEANPLVLHFDAGAATVRHSDDASIIEFLRHLPTGEGARASLESEGYRQADEQQDLSSQRAQAAWERVRDLAQRTAEPEGGHGLDSVIDVQLDQARDGATGRSGDQHVATVWVKDSTPGNAFGGSGGSGSGTPSASGGGTTGR